MLMELIFLHLGMIAIYLKLSFDDKHPNAIVMPAQIEIHFCC